MDQQEFDAGAGQVIVVYQPPDVGTELDPVSIFSGVAQDAAERAARGQLLVSLAAEELRHTGIIFFGQQGSGFESKVAIIAVYRSAGGGSANPAS